MTRSDRIETLLTDVFDPHVLEIRDDSSKHAGHAGASPLGETHYTVTIKSKQFEGKSRVEMQRAVMAALQSEFDTGLHALSIIAKVS